jgi:hypothetical protein
LENVSGRAAYRHIWEDKIKVYLKKKGCEFMDWIHIVKNRDRWWALVNMVMKLPVL